VIVHMIGFDERDANMLERGGIALAAILAGVAALALAGWLVMGCARPRKPETAIEAATYAAELEACAVQSSTCPGYVACRSRVAAAHGRSYSGRCVP